jgi:hypothetical protein
MTSDDLQQRYQAWVDAVIEAGEAWIIGDDEHNTVFEDPDEDRDLHLMFASRADAERHSERGSVTDPIPLEDLPEILDKAEDRGDGLALWYGDSWIVADPGPLAEELRERHVEGLTP